MGLTWGAVVLVCGAAAQAAPKTGSPTAGGAAAAPSSSATPTTGAAPATGSATPGAGGGAPIGADTTTPIAAPDGTSPAPEAAPPAAPAHEADSEEDDEEEAAREAARKKRKRRRLRELEREREADESPAPQPPAAPPAERWSLVGSHFLLSAERMTNVLSWSSTETATSPNGFNESSSTTIEHSGTDVSFLGSGDVTQNLFSTPRIAFDGMFSNGLTLGGSLMYLVANGKSEQTTGTAKTSVEDPTTSIFVLAPRIGVMIPASPQVAVWLRGGVTRISASTDFPSTGGEVVISPQTTTATFVDLTLDPQVVISPMPHVGITVGLALDIGVGGTVETTGSTTTRDIKASSYGATGGLVAIF